MLPKLKLQQIELSGSLHSAAAAGAELGEQYWQPRCPSAQRSAITKSEAEETAVRSALAIFNLLLCLFAAAAAAVAAAAGRSGHVQFMKLRGFWRPDF